MGISGVDMPRSVVDETIARHLKRSMVLKQTPGTGAPPVPGIPFRDAAVNSGTAEEWASITDGVAFVSDSATAKNEWISQEAVDSGEIPVYFSGAPYDLRYRQPITRDQIMQELKSAMGEPFEPSSEFVLYKDSDNIYKSSNLAFAPEDYSVCLIKMWGFAGMLQTENPLAAYKKAVHSIIAGDKDKKFGGAMQTILQKKRDGLKTQFVLQFDGDAAYEKDDPGKAPDKKMSHNLFAPYVAKLIKDTVPGAKVHLCITKLEGNVSKTQQDIMQKFGFFMTSAHAGGGEFGDPLKLRTATNSNLPVLTHSYPYYDRRFFDSVTIQGKVQAYPVVNGKPDYTSEHITQKMVEDLYEKRIVLRVCLAFGGNTHNGVNAIKREIEAGNLSKWDISWRHLIYATK